MVYVTKSELARMEDYCRVRLGAVLDEHDENGIKQYLQQLLDERQFPPYRGQLLDLTIVSEQTGIAVDVLRLHRKLVQPIFDAVSRWVANDAVTRADEAERPRKSIRPRKSGQQRRPIIEFPKALFNEWEDPHTFEDALHLHVERHGDTLTHLFKAIVQPRDHFHHTTLLKWARGDAVPRGVKSFEILERIERRYRLPARYFREKLPHQTRAVHGHMLKGVSAPEQRRLAWHLPHDFARRPKAEQEQILSWVRRVIITGSTEYRRYQAEATKQRYAVRFRSLQGGRRKSPANDESELDAELKSGVIDAPAALEEEMVELLRFKTSTLTAFGLQRNGVWGEETASQKVEHLGLMFGALAAAEDSEVKGYGANVNDLCFAMLIFPSVWDWYLQWRERRRGFYTKWEADMLSIALALVRKKTGWLRQHPALAHRLCPIPGLISRADIDRVSSNWDAACDVMHKHGRNRSREIDRVSRVHRDPFEPILPVLEADSPVGEYRKITEEILRLMPDEHRYPRAAAEAVRSFLILRLGLHTGLRQKNLRELLVCPRDRTPTSERQLEDRKCGELRWSQREQGWEILIPAVAFKNANSSFFGSKPFRLVLPDFGRLYELLDAYIDRHRSRLLNGARDPGTLFVKTVKVTSANAAYNQTTFYEAWKLTIQRYGIYNPYTGRGVIKGLLPHGPHNVRDVLATHILKQTGSYEQASYAIQDTPDMVQKHYGRFLPQDKAAIAAQILNRVWAA